MPIVKANGVDLYYELNTHSGKQPVVLVNGIFQDTTGWAPAVQALGPHFATLAYDCRGQGQSEKPQAGPYDPELHARDLACLLDALSIAKAHFVGVSNGGIVLQHFVRLFPQRVDRLVLADTFSHMDAVQKAMLDGWRAALEAGGSGLRFTVALPWVWGADFLARNLESMPALREKAVQMLPTYSSLHLVDGCARHDARGWLGAIDSPTLIINGAQDLMVQAQHVQFLHERIPKAHLHVIAGAGHAAWLEKADEFNRVVLEFLLNTQ